MHKKIFSYPIVWLLIPFGISLLCILFGAFFDLSLSQAIAKTTNPYGKFIESYGMGIGYCLIMVAGTLLFEGLWERRNIGLRILGWFLLVLSVAATVFFFGDQLHYADDKYGYMIKGIWAFVVAFVFAALTFTLIFLTTKRDNPDYLLKIGVIIILAMLIQYLLVHFIKIPCGRPRYRYLISSYNTYGDTFHAFWQWNPKAGHPGVSSDYFKSWPSGHSATAAIMLLIPLLHPVFRKPVSHGKGYLYLGALLYVILIMYGRVRAGAHFLSDVGFGLLFGLFSSFVPLCIFDAIDKKGKRNKASPLLQK